MLNHSSYAGETAAGGISGHRSNSRGDDNNGDKDKNNKGNDNKKTNNSNNNSDNPFCKATDISSGPALADCLTRKVDYLIFLETATLLGILVTVLLLLGT